MLRENVILLKNVQKNKNNFIVLQNEIHIIQNERLLTDCKEVTILFNVDT